MSERPPIEAIDHRPNPWVRAAAAAPLAMILPLWVAAALVSPMFAAPTFHLLILGAFLAFFARRRNPWARRVPVRVGVDAEGLTVTDDKTGKVERIAKSEITRGVKVPSATGLKVRLSRKKKRDRELAVAREADADAVLEGLGLDAAHTKASFRGMSRIYAKTWRLIATVFAAMGFSMLAGGLSAAIAPGAAPLMAITAMMGMFVLMFWPTRVEVGGDGVLVRWMGRERFIRHADIADVEVRIQGVGRSKRNVVMLTLRSDEVFQIPTGAPSWDGDNANTLAARIREARRVAEEGGAAPSALLMRGDRPHRTWIDALRAREVNDLRTPAVPKDQLWRVIEDAAADPIDRAAAVVALGPKLAADERSRLAGAAKVVAAPKLRVVLEDGPDAEEGELAKMLEEVEVESSKSEGKRARRA